MVLVRNRCRTLAVALVFLASAGMLGAEDNPIAEKPQPISEPVLRGLLVQIRQRHEEDMKKYMTEELHPKEDPRVRQWRAENFQQTVAAWDRFMLELPKDISPKECITVKEERMWTLKGIDADFPEYLGSNGKVQQSKETVLWKINYIIIDLTKVAPAPWKVGVVLSAEALTPARLAQMKADVIADLAVKDLRETLEGGLIQESSGEWMIMPACHPTCSGPFYHITGFHPAAGNPKALQSGWGTFDTLILEDRRISSFHYVLFMKRTDGMRDRDDANESQRPPGGLLGR